VLPQAEASLGRAGENDVVLEASGVSRRHARIFFRAGRYYAEDLGSQNGTRVNGAPLPKPRPLETGDALEVGEVVLSFQGPDLEGEIATDKVLREGPEPVPAPPVAAPEPRAEPAREPSVPVRRTGAEPAEKGVPARESSGVGRRATAAPPEKGLPAGEASGSRRRVGAESAEKGLSGGESSGFRRRVGAEPAEQGLLAGEPSGSRRRAGAEPAERGEAARESSGAGRRATAEPADRAASAQKPSAAPRDGAELMPETAALLKEALAGPLLSPPPPRPVLPPPHKPELRSVDLLLAVVRTRRRREAAAVAEAKRARRPALWGWRVAFFIALATAIAAATLWWPMPWSRRAPPPRLEPETLSTQPLADSFGVGQGVTWRRPEQKAFRFHVDVPRAAAVLRFQARDVSRGELAVSVDGVSLGAVAPDAEGAVREVLVPANALGRHPDHSLVFLHLPTPSGGDTWRVEEVSLEVLPLPALSPGELATRAAEQVDRAERMHGQEPTHLFEVWRAYRSAWLLLEALDAKPPSYADVRARLGLVGRALDARCDLLLLDAQRAIEQGRKEKARQALDEVSLYFPTGEHRCHNLALQKRAQYGL